MRAKRREYYDVRKDELKCQTDACWELGILMGLRDKEISERPAHMQKRLAQCPTHVGDDMLIERLAKKKIRKDEVEDRAQARNVSPKVQGKTDRPPGS